MILSILVLCMLSVPPPPPPPLLPGPLPLALPLSLRLPPNESATPSITPHHAVDIIADSDVHVDITFIAIAVFYLAHSYILYRLIL